MSYDERFLVYVSDWWSCDDVPPCRNVVGRTVRGCIPRFSFMDLIVVLGP